MKIEEIIELSRSYASHDRSGTNSKCYLIGEYALLYGSISINQIEKKINLMNDYINKGINIVPILDYKLDANAPTNDYSDFRKNSISQNGWILQQRAPGHELHFYPKTINITEIDKVRESYNEYISELEEYKERIKEYSNAPQEQITKFIVDYATLEKTELMIDPSKATNFFYDSEVGFSFIDINLKENDFPYNEEYFIGYIIHSIINNPPSMHTYQEGYYRQGEVDFGLIIPTNIAREIEEIMTTMISKIVIGLKAAGISKEQIDKRILKLYEEKFGQIFKRDEEHLSYEEAYNKVYSRLSSIISHNKQNGVMTDQEYSASRGGVIRVQF